MAVGVCVTLIVVATAVMAWPTSAPPGNSSKLIVYSPQVGEPPTLNGNEIIAWTEKTGWLSRNRVIIMYYSPAFQPTVPPPVTTKAPPPPPPTTAKPPPPPPPTTAKPPPPPPPPPTTTAKPPPPPPPPTTAAPVTTKPPVPPTTAKPPAPPAPGVTTAKPPAPPAPGVTPAKPPAPGVTPPKPPAPPAPVITPPKPPAPPKLRASKVASRLSSREDVDYEDQGTELPVFSSSPDTSAPDETEFTTFAPLKMVDTTPDPEYLADTDAPFESEDDPAN